MSAQSETTRSSSRKSGASARGAARLLAVQALYQMHIRGGSAEATVLEFIQHRTDPLATDDPEEDAGPRDADKAAVEEMALALDAVQRVTEGNPPQRVIVVPNKIVNVVV